MTALVRMLPLLLTVTVLLGSTTRTMPTAITSGFGFANALVLPDLAVVRVRAGRRAAILGSETEAKTGQSFRSVAIDAATAKPVSASWKTKSALFAGDGNSKPNKAKGVYVRPSGAIEKGSGFFVPGLEGPKVRLVIGIVLLVATAVNHFLVGDVGSFGRDNLNEGNDEILSFSEGTAILYSLLILFQSAIEYAKEALPEPTAATSGAAKGKGGGGSARASSIDNTEVLEQKWSTKASSSGDPSESSYRSGVQWAAASYLSMTPTTQILLLARDKDGENESVRYRLGSEETENGDATTISSGVSAALVELSNSKGGRIALPLTHPAATALLGASGESDGSSDGNGSKLRTIILQRITDDSCWMVASDQLLAGYTQGDLKWLGRLAGYVEALE